MAWRILIKGTSGAGKSTLGKLLAADLGVPFVELDALHHGPNWRAATADELQHRVLRVLDDPRGWVVDGNYERKLGSMVLERASVVLWLDLPLQTKLWRLVVRTSTRWWRDEELWNGNRESFKDAVWGREALFPWMLRSHFRQRKHWPEQLRGLPLVRLRSPDEVAAWLAQFRAQSP